MSTEIGEYIVGAYLKLIEECDVVDYNVRPPGGGLAGLSELDVVGLRFRDHTAFLCEVTTHILGAQIGKDYNTTYEKVRAKHAAQRMYATKYLDEFKTVEYMYWSPKVGARLRDKLSQIEDLQLVVNVDYTMRIDKLRKLARTKSHNAGNVFFRTLQILEHLQR